VLGTVVLLAQAAVAGPQVITYTSALDGSAQPYALYLSRSYDASRRYPLVISLHGANSSHKLNLRRVFGQGNRPGELDFEASRYFPPLREVDFIVAAPWARGANIYEDLAESEVYDVLADLKRRFSIDDDRVYLTGIGAGGGGALRLALTRPDIWAAVAAVCPAPSPDLEELAGNALNLPIQIFHGERDPLIPVHVTRGWHKRLLEAGAPVEYTEYPGVRHNCWDRAYRDARIFDWFARFRRPANPERVRFTTRWFRYRSSYWAEIDSLTPGSPASIEARVASPGRIEVSTRSLDGFTLSLARATAGGMISRAPVQVAIDGQLLRVKAARQLSFHRAPKGWKSGRYVFAPGSKQPGAEGPLSQAFASRHALVHGPGSPLLAVFAAGHRNAAPSIKPDHAVSPEDGNLILFGTKETNAVIARYADRLPLELNAGAADYGLLFIAFVDGRYVVVSSGLPWWTGADFARRDLASLKDFILFRGSIENVIAEGYFDRDWKPLPEAGASLRASGAVVVK